MAETKAIEQYEFVRLSDLPDLAELCASFHALASGDESAEGFDMRHAAFRKIALDGEEEDGVVALHKEGDRTGQLAGMAVLVRTEMDAFEDLGPWLTGLLVKPEDSALRAELVMQLETVAAEFGYGEIFVQAMDAAPLTAAETAADKSFFENLGYGEIEPFEKAEKEYWVMGKAL
nr:hypothetical protein [uncultured Cohaesibacter sp.]